MWRLGAVLVYLFIAALAYLAGIYVSPVFYFLYLFVLLIPLLSLLQVLLTLMGLRSYQDFDTEHPVKGESIGYRLTIANESIFAGCIVKIRFKAVHPDLTRTLDDLSFTFRGRQSIRKSYEIACPYRGVYTVGLESLETIDLLGWLRIRRPVYHRTFYVYPRIIELGSPPAGSRAYGLARASSTGREDDFALIEGLTDYRAGTPVRHVAWKKFFSTGEPFLKSFGKSARPGVTLYLDLRRQAPPDRDELTAEDCSIEIAVALVKSYLDKRVPVVLKAMGVSLYVFRGSGPEAFTEFYHHTINFLFQKTLSPVDLFQTDRKGSGVEGAVLFISHLPDAGILELLELGEGQSIGAIINQSAMSQDTRRTLRAYREGLADAAERLYLVEGPETIREDLGG